MSNLTNAERALILHQQWAGKLEITPRVSLENAQDLALAYTPGVAEPCKKIAENEWDSYKYTRRANMVAVITDGSAVLGLGNIGALAGMPVMEGKSVLFKKFGGVDAFPICLATQDTDKIIETIVNIAPSFGGINLEDISAPRCFMVERKLKELLDIPVFHDDQHGTAIVVLAGLMNALKLANKKLCDVTITMAGAGAAGTAIAKLLISSGAGNVIMCDEYGALYVGRDHMDWAKTELAEITNNNSLVGSLEDAIVGADVFVGVSVAGIVKPEMVKSMAKNAIVFAMANPVPEIMPSEALAAGALVVGSGRSDFPNQVNNVLVFPGIFRGALDCRASAISENMKKAAAKALANLVSDAELAPDYVLPAALDTRVARAVAESVIAQAKLDGLNRI